MSAADAMVRAMIRAVGMEEEDIDKYRQAAHNRFVDARAFCLGGTLSTGEAVPGQLATIQSNQAVAAQVANLHGKVENLSTQVENLSTLFSTLLEKLVEKEGGKTGGKTIHPQQETGVANLP